MERIAGTFRRPQGSARNGEQGEQWISMSDLMAGLMMVFMLISIAYMRNALLEKEKIKEVAVAYQDGQIALYEELYREFEEDLVRWDAEIDRETLEFRFKSPEVLFATGQIMMRPQFSLILDDFFPRYLQVIKGFRENIAEIRIEGHTSSIWNVGTGPDAAYFNNMRLSQGRTRTVLQYVYEMPDVAEDREWIKSLFAAVGYSSSQLIRDEFGQEDAERSRRVSFRVMTNAEIQIRRILDQ